MSESLHRPLFTSRKLVHISMLIFAFLLPMLTWVQAAGCALLALLFNVFILPHLGVDLGKAPDSASATGAASPSPSAPTWTGIVIYPISVLALILLYRHSLHVVAAAWALMALGDGMASVAGESLRGPSLPYNRGKRWSGFFGFVAAGTLGAYVLMRWVGPGVPPFQAIVVCAAAALVGAVVESLPIRLDDNATVPLVTGAFIFCALFMTRAQFQSNLPYLGRRLILALVVNLAFALSAWALRLVNRSGAVAGFLLGLAVYLGYGYKSFALLLGFFLLGSVATRLGYAKKAARGVAERRGGARSWREATANSLAGAFFAILVITTPHEAAFLIALVATFAEAAGDTVSSEIGQWLSSRAYLITNLRPVPAGKDGGVSLPGSVAGLLASLAIVTLGFGFGLVGRAGALIALSSAVAGNILDSILGATLQPRGLMTNGLVNFASSSFAGGLALALAFRLGY